jgi:hypothetical protein
MILKGCRTSKPGLFLDRPSALSIRCPQHTEDAIADSTI